MIKANASEQWNKVTCGCVLAIFTFNLLFGAWSVNFLLDWIFGKALPLFAAIVVGAFTGQLTIPIAVVVWILKSNGIF